MRTNVNYNSVNSAVYNAASKYSEASQAFSDYLKLLSNKKDFTPGDQAKLTQLEGEVKKRASILEIARGIQNAFYKIMERLAQGLGSIAR
jgi:hypothetical protein